MSSYLPKSNCYLCKKYEIENNHASIQILMPSTASFTSSWPIEIQIKHIEMHFSSSRQILTLVKNGILLIAIQIKMHFIFAKTYIFIVKMYFWKQKYPKCIATRNVGYIKDIALVFMFLKRKMNLNFCPVYIYDRFPDLLVQYYICLAFWEHINFVLCLTQVLIYICWWDWPSL